MKHCSKCKTHKVIDQFYKNKASKDGLFHWCRSCCRAKYKEDNKERIEAKNKKIAIKKEKARARKAERIEAKKQRAVINKEKSKIRSAARYEENKDQIKQRNAAYDKANRDKRRERDERSAEAIKKRRREYYERNKKEIIAKKLIKDKERRQSDPAFRLLENIRARVQAAIKGNIKTGSSLKLLGCTAEHARQHLEAQFTKGMSWETYGVHGWHIDHITPCASFDLSIAEQQCQCFHYTNLQPLWAEDNISKSDKMPEFHQPQLPIPI